MNCNIIIDQYVDWIRKNSEVMINDGLNNRGLISTPFLNANNDHIEIFIEKTEGHFVLSDGGEALMDLQMRGVEFNSPKRVKIFTNILNAYGVTVTENKELVIQASDRDLSIRKHLLIQAILAVGDLFVLSQENVASLFREDVERFFYTNQIIYTKDVKFTGKSKLDQTIDFIIPPYGNRNEERLIKTLNNAAKNSVSGIIFSLNDVASIRDNTQKVVIYNDVESDFSAFMSAFKGYDVTALPWSDKNLIKMTLSG